MPRFATHTIETILAERTGLQRVALDGGRRAYNLTQLTGPVAVGDRVVVNTTAVDLALGTGGWDVVHWNLARETWDQAGSGHIMKLRYTSLQADTGAAEEQAGYNPPADLGERPVVACALHSQLAAVAAAFAHAAPGRRLVYVMTDSAALPLALSDLVADLCGAGLLSATVTAGQAFGGDHEAVNLISALDVAVAEAGAAAIVVGPGPGVVGTGTARGFSGLEVATVLDAAELRGGLPIAALRVSDGDARPRHRGVSHHSTTALGHARAAATVAVPAGEPQPDLPGAHRVAMVETPDVVALLHHAGLAVTTMGRDPGADPRPFAYAAAAGTLAGASLPSSP